MMIENDDWKWWIEAKTPLHNIINPLLIILCLFLLTDVIKLIPNASLSAIVLVNLISLFKQFAELKPLWKTSWADFGCFIVTTIFTVTMGTEAGLISGVVSSLLFMLIAVMMTKRTSSSSSSSSIDEMKELHTPEGMRKDEERWYYYNTHIIGWVVITIPKTFHFLNRDTYRIRVENGMKKTSTKKMVLDMRTLAYIDVSAIMTLQVRRRRRWFDWLTWFL